MNGLPENQASPSVQSATAPIGISQEKPCRKCGATDRYSSGGCKPCNRASALQWFRNNPERVRERSAKWSADNHERALARTAKWVSEHPDQKKAGDAKWQKANRDKVRANSLQWYTDNRERTRENITRWRVAHPENCRASSHKRRTLKMEAGGSFSASEIRAMLKRQKGKCVVCRIDISKAYHVDHIMPIALGGHNGISNIQLLCPHCNTSKQDRHPIDFMQANGFLI